jgi:nucleoside-diphosphate-sugar epimerase
VDVEDVVKVLIMLMGSDIKAERFIVSAGNSSYREIFTFMANALHKKPPRYYANSFMTGLGWRLASLKSALSGSPSIITRETVNNSNSLCYYNNEKLLACFPDFSYAPLTETIGRMARSFIQKR